MLRPAALSAPSAGLLPDVPPGPPATAEVDLSVVIVTYNVRELLEQALRAVERSSSGLSVEVFVVDNDSADGTAAMVRARFPEVHLIANEENVGFAVANNQAIREAAGRHVLVLNPDTVVQEDTLRTLVAFMDAHPEAGAAGCRILNPDGTFAPESRRAFPTPSVAFYRMTGLGRLFPHSKRFGRYNLTYLPKDEVCEVDALSGSCMVVRRAALALSPEAAAEGAHAPFDYDGGTGAGLFDEGFFMYGEDLDWCYRIQQAGWRIYYTPDTQIVHYKGESTKKGELRYVRLFYGAMLRFAEKHFVEGPSPDGASRLRGLVTWVMCRAIQLAIVLRAVLSAAGRLGQTLRAPATEFALSYATLVAAAAAWAPQTPSGFGAAYFWAAAPVYALVGTLGIAVAGGYARAQRHRLRPVVTGLLSGLVGIAAAGFFVKAIAFSRAALVLGFAGAGVLLLARRLRARRPSRARRVVLVGSAGDAARLQRLLSDRPPALSARPSPSLHVVGYVSDEVTEPAQAAADPIRRLGPLRQLRDVARLHDADEVVFASETLTNSAILGQMRALRDLPLQFTILAGYRDCLIGKASVVDLSAPLAEAERTVAPLRPEGARRAVEWALALLGVLAYPALRLLARFRPTPHLRAVTARAARMPSVLAGRRALVGFDPSGPHPPAAWGLQPGVVSVLDLLPHRPTSIVEAHRAYWFYARHQSAALDVEIVVRALLARPAPRAL